MRARLIVSVLSIAACGDGGPRKDNTTPPRTSGSLSIVREAEWPGGGYEVTVRVAGADGQPYLGPAPNFALQSSGDPVETQIAPTVQPPGATAILAVPKPGMAAAVRELIASRPTTELIAVFRWQETARQLVPFTLNRRKFLDGLRELDVRTETRGPAQSVVASVAEVTRRIRGRGPRLMRSNAILGAEPDELVPDESPLLVSSTIEPAALSAISTSIDQWASASYFTIAICAGESGAALTLSADGVDGALPIVVPPTRPEDSGRPCDLNSITGQGREFSDLIEFRFSSPERSTYDARVLSNSKEDFELGVVLWPGTEPVSAVAHLRGRGTLACKRRNYTVNLRGGGRTLFPDSRSDEYYLLSMCADDRYIEQHTANQLMAELDLFPVQFRYVELRVDDETQGVYLLMEKMREEIVRDNSRVRSVLRRRFSPPDDFFEFKWAAEGVPNSNNDLEAFLTSLNGLSGETLWETVSERLDLEQYLRWVALMTMEGNGDYVDEMWIYDTERGDSSQFGISGWDNDDLFSECHFSGAYAFADPNQLIYCAESRLDHLLFADSFAYARYVDILEGLLQVSIPPERFDAAVDFTGAKLLPYFERADICAASTRFIADNPAAVDPEIAQADIRERLSGLKTSYLTRRDLLLQRITAYRGRQ